MAKTENASTVGAHVPNALLPFIDKLAKDLGVSRSRYVSLLLIRWYIDGCKPADRNDETLLYQSLRWNELPARPATAPANDIFPNKTPPEIKPLGTQPAAPAKKKKPGPSGATPPVPKTG